MDHTSECSATDPMRWSGNAKSATEAVSEPQIIREQLEQLEARRRLRVEQIERQMGELHAELKLLNQLGERELSAVLQQEIANRVDQYGAKAPVR